MKITFQHKIERDKINDMIRKNDRATLRRLIEANYFQACKVLFKKCYSERIIITGFSRLFVQNQLIFLATAAEIFQSIIITKCYHDGPFLSVAPEAIWDAVTILTNQINICFKGANTLITGGVVNDSREKY